MAGAARGVRSEDRRERFRRLAEKRVVQTIKNIRLIGNLANRNNYEFEQGDVDRMFRALEKEIKQAKSAFGKNTKRNGVDFSL